MKGIVLAGGTGSRLHPLTAVANKHLLPVGNYPMVFQSTAHLKRLVTTIGVKNLSIIETDDAILVAQRGSSQNVKALLETLKASGRREVHEHTTTIRPWGIYRILEESSRFKIKSIVVNVGAVLSLQRHIHRTEHWVVIHGTAQVTIGEKTFFVHEGESTFVPKTTLHRLGNPGKVPLEIIEVQNGEYVGEDDIERVDDAYGRASRHERP